MSVILGIMNPLGKFLWEIEVGMIQVRIRLMKILCRIINNMDLNSDTTNGNVF